MRSVRQQEEMRPRSHSSTMSVGPNSDAKSGAGGRRQVNTLGPSWRTRCDSMPVPNRQAPGRGARVRGSSEGEDGQQELAIASSNSPVRYGLERFYVISLFIHVCAMARVKIILSGCELLYRILCIMFNPLKTSTFCHYTLSP